MFVASWGKYYSNPYLCQNKFDSRDSLKWTNFPPRHFYLSFRWRGFHLNKSCLSTAYINLLLVARCYLHRIDAKNRNHIKLLAGQTKSTSSYKSCYVNLPQASRCYLHRLDVKNGGLSKAVYWSNKAKVQLKVISCRVMIAVSHDLSLLIPMKKYFLTFLKKYISWPPTYGEENFMAPLMTSKIFHSPPLMVPKNLVAPLIGPKKFGGPPNFLRPPPGDTLWPLHYC